MKSNMSLSAVCFLLLLTAVSEANEESGFAGFYQLSVASDQIDEVWVTISGQFFNDSDADVDNVMITLEDSHLAGTSYGSFPFVSVLFNGDSVFLTQDFLVPRKEFEWWQSGAHPRVRVEFQDGNGDTVQHLIELVMMPVGDQP